MQYKNIIVVWLWGMSLSLWAQSEVNPSLNTDTPSASQATVKTDEKPLFAIQPPSDATIQDETGKSEQQINVVKVIDFTQTPALALDVSKSDQAINSSRSLKRAISYTVRGKTYQTLAESEGFVQEGSASWYGPGFHGRKTASGEIYNMNDYTAAHKELPLGTEVEVTNLSTGKSVIVRINDRGPFHGNRVLDLSRAAAKELGVIKRGTAEVSIRALQ